MTRPPLPDEDSLQRINAIKLTTSDLLVFLVAGATLQQLREDVPNPAMWPNADVKVPPGDQGDKASALLSRMQALAELLYGGVPGWAEPFPTASGRSNASRAIFAAAAEQPLVLHGHTYAFDRTAFFERVALIAEQERPIRAGGPSGGPGTGD